jgi:thiol:disulfide interchange protein DsbD
VKNLAELDAAMRGAAGRYVMLDFYADWCVSCKELERFTFADAQVSGPAQGRAAAPGRRHRQQSDDKALLARFKLFGPPGIIFFDKAGNEVAYRVIGYEPADKFLSSLGQAIP